MTSTVRDEIALLANARFPEEACGFVLRDNTVVECRNTADDPVNNFRIDPVDVALWWETEQVAALWHTHPQAPAVPSEEDERIAGESWLAGPYLVYSVTDEDLGWYAWDADTGKLELVAMESPQ